ncbi:MAG: hypothetical protein JXB60_07115 [Candidatus Cloacimonetes bacterium]|nr:hypothetical protein [Candidatus Cloacimonadota bacterium]
MIWDLFRVRKVKDLLPRGAIIFERGCDFISQAIIEAQDIFWEEEAKKSQWSHIGFIGADGYFYESTVKFSGRRFVYGVRITQPSQLIKEMTKNDDLIGIQYDLDMNRSQWEKATAKARQMKREKYVYGGLELFGTLLRLWRWKLTRDPRKRKNLLQKRNPFNLKKSLYCIAFVADCLEAAGVEYISVEHSIATVDHGWYTTLPHRKRIIEIEEARQTKWQIFKTGKI